MFSGFHVYYYVGVKSETLPEYLLYFIRFLVGCMQLHVSVQPDMNLCGNVVAYPSCPKIMRLFHPLDRLD